MDLDDLHQLPVSDQQIFLLGRIASETTRMDAALRQVHAALRGLHDLDAFLDAPDFFSTNAKACKQLVKDSTLDAETRTAVNQAVTYATQQYTRRNRYIHDFLRRSLADQSWELARLSRQEQGTADVEQVSFDDAVELVMGIVTASWRLRGCALYVLNGTWQGMALGHVEGDWDGSASYVR